MIDIPDGWVIDHFRAGPSNHPMVAVRVSDPASGRSVTVTSLGEGTEGERRLRRIAL